MIKGVVSTGLRMPVFKEGDDIAEIISNSIITDARELNLYDKDVICITESVVARTTGNYVSVDNIAHDVREHFNEKESNGIDLWLWNPIYSRNRFSLILKGIARAAKKLHIVLNEKDEVGNAIYNKFTGINIRDFYTDVVIAENCEIEFCTVDEFMTSATNIIVCSCHPENDEVVNRLADDSWRSVVYLSEICSKENTTYGYRGYNEEYGVLGSNKATEDTLKLFPRKSVCKEIINTIQSNIKEKLGVHVEVMVYGDGCFKDPVGGIWEFADPVVAPAYTDGLEGTPNEIKLKYLVDNELSDVDEKIELSAKVKDAIIKKEKNLVGKMTSEGTTPRRYVDLLGSLADLTSGSGDKGTPVVLIQNYFNNYAS